MTASRSGRGLAPASPFPSERGLDEGIKKRDSDRCAAHLSP